MDYTSDSLMHLIPTTRMTQPLLSIRDLRTHFSTRRGVTKVLDGLSLDVQRGQIVGLVG